MSPFDEVESFRSAIEWPSVSSEDDVSSGEFKPLSACLRDAFDTLLIACSIERECESPIETELGVKITKALRVINDETLSLISQYVLGSFRYDFAIVREGRKKPIVIIECDGKEFHSTSEQLANDREKDSLAKAQEIFILRFTGSEIFREADSCVAKILKMMRYKGHLTQPQCDSLDIAGIRRR
jgi:very-short-patch-repair endonuclease